jgi:hypothetical protein
MYLPLLPAAQKMQPPAPPTPPRLPVMHSTGVPLAAQTRAHEATFSNTASLSKPVEWLPVTCEGMVVYIRHLAAPPRNRLLPIL